VCLLCLQVGAQSGKQQGKQYDFLMDESIDFIAASMLAGEGDFESKEVRACMCHEAYFEDEAG
jgi:hypothetical protein